MREEVIEAAFVQSFNAINANNKELVDSFMLELKATLEENNDYKESKKLDKEIEKLETKKKNLLQLKLEEVLTKEDFNSTYKGINKELEVLKEKQEEINLSAEEVKDIKETLAVLKKELNYSEPLIAFDSKIFNEVVEEVILGGEFDGVKDPTLIKFVYRSGKVSKAISAGSKGKKLFTDDQSVECKSKKSSYYKNHTCGDQ